MILPCLILSNIRYVSRVKWSNPGRWVAPSSSFRCSSNWKGSLLFALDYGRQIYLLTYYTQHRSGLQCMGVLRNFDAWRIFNVKFSLSLSLSLSLYIYIYIYIYILYIYLCVCVCVCVHAYTHTFTHMHVFVCVCVFIANA